MAYEGWMQFLKRVAALFTGALALFAAVIVGTTLHDKLGVWAMAGVAIAAYVVWLITVRSLQQPRRVTRYHEQDGPMPPVARGSSDIVRRGSPYLEE